MKLAIELLSELLGERFGLESNIVYPHALLNPPLLYVPGQKLERGGLYLTDVDVSVPANKEVCMLYAGGCKPAQTCGNALLVREDIGTAFNAVQKIFTLYEKWEDQLRQIVLEQGELQKLLQAARSLLINPILVMGLDFSLVAQAGEGELSPNQRLSNTLTEPVNIYTELRQDPLFNQQLSETKPFLYPVHILRWPSWNVNIFQNGRATYRLVLAESGQKLRDCDGWLLSRLAVYVSYQLRADFIKRQSDSRLRALLTRVLIDAGADQMEISRQLNMLGWSSEDTYFCMVLKMMSGSAARIVCEALKKRYPHSCSCTCDDKIVTFFNMSLLNRELSEVMDELKYFIRDNLLKAGYSRAMQGHLNLRRQYIQACEALEIGLRRNPYQWIHHFNSISLHFLLEEATRRLPCNMICSEKLLKLQEYDRTHNTDYMDTLRVYLDCNLNIMQSARQLYIHRSTMLYRLEKVKQILESALDDPEELLYISLSFRLLDGEKKRLTSEHA